MGYIAKRRVLNSGLPLNPGDPFVPEASEIDDYETGGSRRMQTEEEVAAMVASLLEAGAIEEVE